MSIERVHIRYEDSVSLGDGHTFACGVMLEKIEARTTNSQGQPQQVDGKQLVIHKVCAAGNLQCLVSVY